MKLHQGYRADLSDYYVAFSDQDIYPETTQSTKTLPDIVDKVLDRLISPFIDFSALVNLGGYCHISDNADGLPRPKLHSSAVISYYILHSSTAYAVTGL